PRDDLLGHRLRSDPVARRLPGAGRASSGECSNGKGKISCGTELEARKDARVHLIEATDKNGDAAHRAGCVGVRNGFPSRFLPCHAHAELTDKKGICFRESICSSPGMLPPRKWPGPFVELGNRALIDGGVPRSLRRTIRPQRATTTGLLAVVDVAAV